MRKPLLKIDTWHDEDYERNNKHEKRVVIVWLSTLIIAFVLWGLFFCLIAKVVHADEEYDTRAIKAIIGEAENQDSQGMLAVACAIRNRGTLKGVYGENAPRVKNHKYSDLTAIMAFVAWNDSELSQSCSFLQGATNWENIKAFGKPKWAYKMKETYRYKDHVFYKGVK